MKLKTQRKGWESLARVDPMWAILAVDDKRGQKWSRGEFFENGRAEIQSLMTHLTVLGASLKRNSALDFGCGIGRLTQALTEHFENCVGVDISLEMISLANGCNRFPDRCHYVLNETSDLQQFSDDSFDFVYSNIVLQHITPAVSTNYIRGFVRILRPGGVLVFQIPHHIPWTRRIQWRRRLFLILQALGVDERHLIERLGLNPMRMAYIPQQKVEWLLRSADANVVEVKAWSDLDIESRRYIATKNPTPKQ